MSGSAQSGGSDGANTAGASSAKRSGRVKASSSSSKWTVVRPWQPPHNRANDAEAALEEGQSETTGQLYDEETDEEGAMESLERLPEASSSSSTGKRRMQLEVIDVSSTSVSLSVSGQPEDPANNSASPALFNRRQRSASTISERNLPTSNPPNISIKLNSAAWPHVFHTDASFFDAEHVSSGRIRQEDSVSSASSILVWGLSPGINYHIELGVFEDDLEEVEEGVADAADSLEEIEPDIPDQASASVRTLDAVEPDVPPPPYSSYDPSLPSDAGHDAEASLRAVLEQLRIKSKQAESSLHSAIAALRRSNDKLTREDQRHRQRIHMLEDSTARLREVAAEEDAESASIQEAALELEDTERSLTARLSRRRNQLEETERQAKEELDRHEAEMSDLKERLEKATVKEEEVLGEKMKLERELLPTYNIQLATLEADLRRVMDDHRRQYAYSHNQPNYGYGVHTGISGRSASLRLAGRHQPVHHQQHHQQSPQNYYDDPGYTRGSMLPTQIHQQAMYPTQDTTFGHFTPATASSQGSARTQPTNDLNTGFSAPSTVLPIGSRNRSASLTKPTEKQESSKSGESLDGVDTEPRATSRFAWSQNNSWAAKVAGGKPSGGV